MRGEGEGEGEGEGLPRSTAVPIDIQQPLHLHHFSLLPVVTFDPLPAPSQLLHSKELHAAVVTKHGPTIMRGAVMLNPLTHLWMQVR